MPPKSINLSSTALEEVSKRLKPDTRAMSGQVSQDLERYYEALRRSRAALRTQLTEAELMLICDANHDTMYDSAVSVQMLPGGIEDAIRLEGLDAKWEIDGGALVRKLEELSFIDRAALVDAVEQFGNWTPKQDGEGRPGVLAFLK